MPVSWIPPVSLSSLSFLSFFAKSMGFLTFRDSLFEASVRGVLEFRRDVQEKTPAFFGHVQGWRMEPEPFQALSLVPLWLRICC